MIPLMLAGKYNPGQLVAVREILSACEHACPCRQLSTPPCSKAIADYSVFIDDSGTLTNFADDVITVIDNSATPLTGPTTSRISSDCSSPISR